MANFRFINKIFIAKIGILLVFALGITVLIGWYQNIPLLIQVSESFVAMQYNTALCFVLISIAALGFLLKKPNLLRFTAGTATLIASLTLIQYLFNINTGLDELFMDHYILTETSHAGRMAPNTALCFILSSLSIILLNTRHKEIAGVIASMVFGLGLVAFIGYFLHEDYTYGWGSLTKMAIHTASGFIIYALSLSLLFPNLFLKGSNDYVVSGYILSIMATIYLIDISTPLGIADGTLYVLVVLFTWNYRSKPLILLTAVICTVLTIIGYTHSPDKSVQWIAQVNRTVSIAVIWVTYFLIVRLKTKEAALKKSNSTLLDQNSNLENFTYIASHDLQEPLRTIRSLINFVTDDLEDSSEEIKQNLNRINHSATRMSELVKDLLDFSRIGQNQTAEEVDSNQLIHAIKLDLQHTIDDKGAEIEIIGSLPTINAYKTELRLLFQNLISNGLKFQNPDNIPKITIECNENTDYWEFVVSDNGIGMESKYLNKIFDIFHRLHTSKSYSGTGIGLAHCKKIVTAHKGTISVISSIGKGSSFTFSISKNI